MVRCRHARCLAVNFDCEAQSTKDFRYLLRLEANTQPALDISRDDLDCGIHWRKGVLINKPFSDFTPS